MGRPQVEGVDPSNPMDTLTCFSVLEGLEDQAMELEELAILKEKI